MDHNDHIINEVIKGMALPHATWERMVALFIKNSDDPIFKDNDSYRFITALPIFIDHVRNGLISAGYATENLTHLQIILAFMGKPLSLSHLNRLLDGFEQQRKGNDTVLNEALMRFGKTLDPTCPNTPFASNTAPAPVHEPDEPISIPNGSQPLIRKGGMSLPLILQLQRHIQLLDDTLQNRETLHKDEVETYFQDIVCCALKDFGYGSHQPESIHWSSLYSQIGIETDLIALASIYSSNDVFSHWHEMSADDRERLDMCPPQPLITAEPHIARIAKCLAIDKNETPYHAVYQQDHQGKASPSPHHGEQLKSK